MREGMVPRRRWFLDVGLCCEWHSCFAHWDGAPTDLVWPGAALGGT